jgi:UPF0716 protein FxsA
MYVFLAFLLVPLIEIALFIQVGTAIGLWPTLGIVILTAVLGTWLVRSQGQAALMRLRQSFSALDDPTEPLAHGAMILFAGALLLTPGFFTDAVGFALLIPSVRMFVMRYLSARVSMQSFHMGSAQGHGFSGGTVIDGEFEEVRPEKDPRTPPPSGWVEGPERH